MARIWSMLKKMPNSLLIMFLVFLAMPLWSLSFAAPPWTPGTAVTADVLLRAFVFWIGPIAVALTVLARSFFFIPVFSLECAGLLATTLMSQTSHSSERMLVAVASCIVATLLGLILANRDLLHPFLRQGSRGWRMNPRLYANARITIEAFQGDVVAVMEDCSVTGLAASCAAPAGQSVFGDAPEGKRVRLRHQARDHVTIVEGEIVRTRVDGGFLRFAIRVDDVETMRRLLDNAGPVERFGFNRWLVKSSARRAALAIWVAATVSAVGAPACGTDYDSNRSIASGNPSVDEALQLGEEDRLCDNMYRCPTSHECTLRESLNRNVCIPRSECRTMPCQVRGTCCVESIKDGLICMGPPVVVAAGDYCDETHVCPAVARHCWGESPGSNKCQSQPYSCKRGNTSYPLWATAREGDALLQCQMPEWGEAAADQPGVDGWSRPNTDHLGYKAGIPSNYEAPWRDLTSDPGSYCASRYAERQEDRYWCRDRVTMAKSGQACGEGVPCYPGLGCSRGPGTSAGFCVRRSTDLYEGRRYMTASETACAAPGVPGVPHGGTAFGVTNGTDLFQCDAVNGWIRLPTSTESLPDHLVKTIPNGYPTRWPVACRSDSASAFSAGHLFCRQKDRACAVPYGDGLNRTETYLSASNQLYQCITERERVARLVVKAADLGSVPNGFPVLLTNDFNNRCTKCASGMCASTPIDQVLRFGESFAMCKDSAGKCARHGKPSAAAGEAWTAGDHTVICDLEKVIPRVVGTRKPRVAVVGVGALPVQRTDAAGTAYKMPPYWDPYSGMPFDDLPSPSLRFRGQAPNFFSAMAPGTYYASPDNGCKLRLTFSGYDPNHVGESAGDEASTTTWYEVACLSERRNGRTEVPLRARLKSASGNRLQESHEVAISEEHHLGVDLSTQTPLIPGRDPNTVLIPVQSGLLVSRDSLDSKCELPQKISQEHYSDRCVQNKCDDPTKLCGMWLKTTVGHLFVGKSDGFGEGGVVVAELGVNFLTRKSDLKILGKLPVYLPDPATISSQNRFRFKTSVPGVIERIRYAQEIYTRGVGELAISYVPERTEESFQNIAKKMKEVGPVTALYDLRANHQHLRVGIRTSNEIIRNGIQAADKREYPGPNRLRYCDIDDKPGSTPYEQRAPYCYPVGYTNGKGFEIASAPAPLLQGLDGSTWITFSPSAYEKDRVGGGRAQGNYPRNQLYLGLVDPFTGAVVEDLLFIDKEPDNHPNLKEADFFNYAFMDSDDPRYKFLAKTSRGFGDPRWYRIEFALPY